MAAEKATLATFYDEWQLYQQHLREAIATLTDAQLALAAVPGQRSVGQLAAHIISGRIDWFGGFLDEAVDPALQERWGGNDPSVGTVAELVAGLEASWTLMADAIARWTQADMEQTYPIEWRGDHYDLTRGWVVWHILAHDLHHGGEISLTLGIHGSPAADIYSM